MKRLVMTVAVSALALSPALAQEKSGATEGAPFLDTTDAMIEGSSITNVSVQIDQPGYIVIHDEAAGAPPASLGHLAIQPGKTGDLTIEAEGELDPANNITLMLHYETNDNNTYDFGPGMTDVDGPVSVGDAVVTAPVDGGM